MDLTDFSKPTPLVKQALAHLPAGRVLDTGAHQGRNSIYLARAGWEVTAIDTDAAALAVLQQMADREGLKIHTAVADIREYEPPESFDAVLSLMVLHFLPAPDIEPAIRKMRSWTIQGGMNIVSAFTSGNPIGTRPYLFQPDALRAFYDDWEIKRYKESYTSWIIPEGKTDPEQYQAARLIARKPIL